MQDPLRYYRSQTSIPRQTHLHVVSICRCLDRSVFEARSEREELRTPSARSDTPSGSSIRRSGLAKLGLMHRRRNITETNWCRKKRSDASTFKRVAFPELSRYT